MVLEAIASGEKEGDTLCSEIKRLNSFLRGSAVENLERNDIRYNVVVLANRFRRPPTKMEVFKEMFPKEDKPNTSTDRVYKRLYEHLRKLGFAWLEPGKWEEA